MASCVVIHASAVTWAVRWLRRQPSGILMCGWSSGFFFAVLSRMFEQKTKFIDPTP